MEKRFLVVYASKKGSTKGIADAIGKELQSMGFRADVAQMQEVTSLEGYDALVAGAPVYTGKVMRDLAVFAARHADAILKIPVAVFTAGIAPVYPKTGNVSDFTGQLTAAVQPAVPVAVTMFAGSLDPAGLSFVERGLTSLLKVPTGDFRDWNAITDWARQLPALMGFLVGTKD